MATQILLNPVERVEVLTLIDNVLDLLLLNTDVAKRMGPAGTEGQRMPVVEAPLLESGDATDAPVAEHGLSFLVSVTSGAGRRTLLFDTGSTVGTLVHNLRALGVNLKEIESIVLSHGHFDHTTGLNGLAKTARAPAATTGSSGLLAAAARGDSRAGALRVADDQRGEGSRRRLPGDRETRAVVIAGWRRAGDGRDRAHDGL